MSEFDGFFTDFSGWDVKSAEFFAITDNVVVDGVMQPPSRASVGTANVGKWIESTLETDINGKFVPNEKGKIVLKKPAFTIDTKTVAVIDGEDYFIVGPDDIGSLGETLLLTYIRQGIV